MFFLNWLYSYKYYDSIVNNFVTILNQYCYKRIVPNTLENLDTFSHTLGVSSDIVQKEMYTFKDKSNNDLVLRPEGTAVIMRYLCNE